MRYERDTWGAFLGIKYLRFNRDLVLDLVADFSDSVISKFRTFQWKIKSAVSYSNTSSDSPTRILYNISGDSVGFLLIPLNWKIKDFVHLTFPYLQSHGVQLLYHPPPLKNTPPPLSCQVPPPLNLQTVQTPLFRQSPLFIGFSSTPPPL